MLYSVKVLYTYVVGDNRKTFYETSILSVEASSFDQAYEKVEHYVRNGETEHINPNGEMVKTVKVDLLDCFMAFDEMDGVREIYSSTTRNCGGLSEEAFYNAITYQCDVEDTLDLRYK